VIEIIKIRIRLFLSRRILFALFVVFPLLISLVSLEFLGSDEVEIKSRIGIVDEDNTFLSERLVERLLEDKTLLVLYLDSDEAMNKLIDESVTGLYTIKKGFSDKVESGQVESLIKIQYLSDNYIASGVTDIITPYFLYDVLKSITEKEVVQKIGNRDDLEGDFAQNFRDLTFKYENEEDLELQVITEIIKGDYDKALYSPSKEILVRYLVSLMLIFHLVSAFYQSMAVYEDIYSRIIERIRLSKAGFLQYEVGNIAGIGLMIFVISLFQFILLKLLFFSHLNILMLAVDLLLYSMSISVLACTLAHIFRSRADYQMAVPYLVTAIWLLGNWMYSGDILSIKIPEVFTLIPGMAVKDHILSSFLNLKMDFDIYRIIKEVGVQLVLIFFMISITVAGGSHNEGRS